MYNINKKKMIDIEVIRKNYSKFSDDKLIKIVSEINSLRKEVIPILQNELIKRDLSIQIEIVNNYIINQLSNKEEEEEEECTDKKINYKIFIGELLKQKVSFENIKNQLNEINILEIFESQDDMFFLEDYIEYQRKKGKTVTEIAREFKENLNIPYEVTSSYCRELSRKMERRISIGVGIFFVALIMFILSFIKDETISITYILFMIMGAFSVIRNSMNYR